MKIVILTQYFPPEVGAPQNRLFELAVRLKKSGADVTVLTAMPNYPHMRIQEGYRGKWFMREEMDGVKIIRTGIYVPQSKSIVPRLLNYFSFVFTSLFFGLFTLRKSDWLMCESPPLFLGMSAYVLSRVKRTKLIFNVSDLWPESAEKLGLVTNRYLLGLSTKLEEFLYRKSALITGQTQGIVANIQSRFPEKTVYWLPNGVDTKFYVPFEDKGWRAKNGFATDDLLLLYAGIIGHAQGLEVILQAAEKLRTEPRVKFILLGEGPEKKRLIAMKEQLGLSNVIFLDAIPKKEMPELLAAMDAAVVPLRKLDLFKGAIPSKIFENLAMKKPVLLGVEGEAKELFIDEGKSGLFFEPENADALAACVKQLLAEPGKAKQLGENGRRYVEEKFERNMIANRFRERLESMPKVSQGQQFIDGFRQALIVLSAFCLPFGRMVGFFTALLTVLWAFDGRWKEKITALRTKILLWPIFIFYLLCVAGMLWTSNISEGAINIQVKVCLLLLPLALSTTTLDVRRTQRFIFSFLAGLTAVGIFMLVRSTILYFSTGENTFYYQAFSNELVHPSYLSMYFCVGIMMLFHGVLLQSFPKRQKAFAILLCLFFAVIVFLLSSKLGILSMLLLFAGYIVYAILRFKRYVVGIAALVTLIAGCFIALKAFPQMAARLERMKEVVTMSAPVDPKEVESNQVRLLVWKADVSIIERHPWAGVGIGDAEDSLKAEYHRRGMEGAEREGLNAHSQLLQTGVELGFIGIASLLLLVLVPAVWGLRKQFGFVVLFALLFLLNIIPESMLEVQAGTLFLGFFYSLILLSIDRRCLTPLKAPPFRFL